jgi:Xaa-Pro dipeptidase
MAIPILTKQEFIQRHDNVRTELSKLGLDGAVIFNPVRVTYLTGFAHCPTERPIILVLPVEADPIMLLPILEEQHFKSQAPWFARVDAYDEYPGYEHPMLQLKRLIAEFRLRTNKLGADHDGAMDLNGYQGLPLSDQLGFRLTPVSNLIDRVRMVKSSTELAILREAGHWAAQAHGFLQEAISIGRSERSICRQAEDKTLDLLSKASRDDVSEGSVSTIETLLSGERTTMPHSFTSVRPVQAVDVVVTCCQGIMSGYNTELERTLFVGQPTNRQKELFDIVYQAQELQLSMLRPGNTCAEIDKKVRDWFSSKGCSEFVLHHQGHGLGLEGHERPFLDVGDPTVIKAGMVLSVEPGLYVSGVGGFRHSDTVLVGEQGVEFLTPYARELDQLVI